MADLIGKVLGGRFRVDTFLGRGGMADVFKVWDLQRATFLAMKVLHDDLAEDEVFLRRFEREARTLELLQHPNIVRCYGLEQAGPVAFILMDYIDGLTLRKEIFLNKSGLLPERILDVMRPICAALFYAHQMGLAHCDIKPANIMVHRNGTVYLADFGIARMTEASTLTMMDMGTPAYMAPEQLRGGEEPTPAADLYSLGVVLYEMVTGGHRPFTGDAALSHPDGGALTGMTTTGRILWEKNNLPPPSPRTFNPNISAGLETVILRCLERTPGRRYRTALELLEALEIAIRGEMPDDNTLTPIQPESAPRPIRGALNAWSSAVASSGGTGQGRSPVPGRLGGLIGWISARVMSQGFRRYFPWVLGGAAGIALALFGLSLLKGEAHGPSNPGTPTARAASGAVGIDLTEHTLTPQVTATLTRLSSATAPAAATATAAATAAAAATVTPPPLPTLMGGSGRIAYAYDNGDQTIQVWVMNADNPERRQQITYEPGGACQPVWSPDGQQIVYTTPCRGPSVYYPGATLKIVHLDTGKTETLPLKEPGSSGSFDPAWSPDGQTLAFTIIYGKRTEIHAYNFETRQITSLATRGLKNAQPAWSPDGQHLAFITTDELSTYQDALWLMDKNGGSRELLSTTGVYSEPVWLPDGQHLLVSHHNGSNMPVLALIDRDNPGQGAQPLLDGAYLMSHSSISPDGAWIVFWTDQVNQRHNREIMMVNLADKKIRQLTNNNRQDFQPSWSPR